mgnify:CR=1 FL=1
MSIQYLQVGGSIREALQRQLAERRHVLAVAKHHGLLGRALGPSVETGVEAELGPLVVARGPVAASAGATLISGVERGSTNHYSNQHNGNNAEDLHG